MIFRSGTDNRDNWKNFKLPKKSTYNVGHTVIVILLQYLSTKPHNYLVNKPTAGFPQSALSSYCNCLPSVGPKGNFLLFLFFGPWDCYSLLWMKETLSASVCLDMSSSLNISFGLGCLNSRVDSDSVPAYASFIIHPLF